MARTCRRALHVHLTPELMPLTSLSLSTEYYSKAWPRSTNGLTVQEDDRYCEIPLAFVSHIYINMQYAYAYIILSILMETRWLNSGTNLILRTWSQQPRDRNSAVP